MIPFNFEKFQSGGYKVITRDGREVNDLKEQETMIAALVDELPCSWFPEDGTYFIEGQSPLDLFLIPLDEKKEISVRDFLEGKFGSFNSTHPVTGVDWEDIIDAINEYLKIKLQCEN